MIVIRWIPALAAIVCWMLAALLLSVPAKADHHFEGCGALCAALGIPEPGRPASPPPPLFESAGYQTRQASARPLIELWSCRDTVAAEDSFLEVYPAQCSRVDEIPPGWNEPQPGDFASQCAVSLRCCDDYGVAGIFCSEPVTPFVLLPEPAPGVGVLAGAALLGGLRRRRTA